MPTKRRAAAAPPPPSAPVARPSKLAKEHGITAAQEGQIREAFTLFQSEDSPSKLQDAFMPTSSVRRALAALDVAPGSSAEMRELLDAADPEDEGIVSYEAFVGVAALQMSLRGKEEEGEEEEGPEEMDEEEEDEYEEVIGGRGNRAPKRKGKGTGKGTGKGKGKAKVDEAQQQANIEHAFRLFTGAEGQELITFGMLKRIARDLKEDVSDDMLRNMLKEASGGTRGVNLQEFEALMRRAGVFR